VVDLAVVLSVLDRELELLILCPAIELVAAYLLELVESHLVVVIQGS
jgi:hypothetical protein